MVDCINGHNGKKITSIPLGKIAEKFNAGFYQLHRNDLISILKNKVEDFGIKINYGSAVNNLTQNSSNVKFNYLIIIITMILLLEQMVSIHLSEKKFFQITNQDF